MKSTGQHKLKPTLRIWGSDPGPFHGNDIKKKGGHVARCKICGAMSKLCLSHVVPKWAHKWHKDASKGVVVTTLLSRGVSVAQQDGGKHYLLCQICEQIASISERYAQAIVNVAPDLLRASGTVIAASDGFQNLRIDLIAQFVAFIALRVHYARGVSNLNTYLPARARKIFRRLALTGASLDEVAITAWRFLPPKSNPEHDPRQDVSFQYEENVVVGRVFIVLAGGIEWAIHLDPKKLVSGIGDIGFRGIGVEQITSLPYNEYRLFKYPEKWALKIKMK